MAAIHGMAATMSVNSAFGNHASTPARRLS